MIDTSLILSDILKAIPWGIGLSFLIGPVFFVLLETSATKGGRAAVALDLGVIMADFLFIVIAYLSSYQLLKQTAHHPALYLLGGMIMAFYGLVSIIKKPMKESLENKTELELPKNNYLNLFMKGFFLNFINIGVLAFWLGMIVAFSPKLDMNTTRIFVFFGTILATYFVVDLGKIYLAKQLKNILTPLWVMRIRKLVGLIILIGGLYIIFEGFYGNAQLKEIQHIQHLQSKEQH